MKKILAPILALALILVSPGLGTYELAAQSFGVASQAGKGKGPNFNGNVLRGPVGAGSQVRISLISPAGLKSSLVSPVSNPDVTKTVMGEALPASSAQWVQFVESVQAPIAIESGVFVIKETAAKKEGDKSDGQVSAQGVLIAADQQLSKASEGSDAEAVTAGREVFDIQLSNRGEGAVSAEGLTNRSSGLAAHTETSSRKEVVVPSAEVKVSRTVKTRLLNAAVAFGVLFNSNIALAQGSGAAKSAAATTAAGSSLAHFVPAAPLLYEAVRWIQKGPDAKDEKAEKRSFGDKVSDVFEVGAGAAVMTLFGGLAVLALGAASPLLPVVMAAYSYAMYRGIYSELERTRGHGIRTWQASHDQKYRTDYNTGKLRDIRGQSYANDHGSAHILGGVGRTGVFVLRMVAAFGGLVWLMNAGMGSVLMFNAVLAVIYLLHDALRGDKNRSGEQTRASSGTRPTPSPQDYLRFHI